MRTRVAQRAASSRRGDAHPAGTVVASATSMAQRPHVALLGDSIFDNAAYIGGAPDGGTHLRRLLPAPWRATLCAVDGATTHTLDAQLDRVPPDATHLVISIGGNDALQNSDLLSLPVRSSAEALRVFADRVKVSEPTYRAPSWAWSRAGV